MNEIKKENNQKKYSKTKMLAMVTIVSISMSVIFGSLSGIAAFYLMQQNNRSENPKTQISNKIIPDEKIKIVQEESTIIDVVKKVNPAVVSIIVTKDIPKIERYFSSPDDFFGSPFNFRIPQERQNGTEKQEVGGGSGFIVSPDGFIATNKHVVEDESAEYTVLMNNEKKYTAKVLARDSFNDIAILKIDEKNLPTMEFGNSDSVDVGQTAIAIGNALGEFRNTVSVGVVSGLKRSITAGGRASGGVEHLSGIIQTDAAINPGNSGGPLLNSSGQVIGMNVAIVQNAQSIGFAIPMNDVKKVTDDVIKNGRIIRPYIGIRYLQINKDIASKNKLSVDYGALIVRGQNFDDLAVIPSSPANKAGLVENDIVLEADGIKLDESNSLAQIVQKHNVGDEVNLKVLHKGQENIVKIKLEESKL